MTKSKTDKHLTLSYKKTISKTDLYTLKGCFCKVFAFTSEAHISKKINTCRTNCHIDN